MFLLYCNETPKGVSFNKNKLKLKLKLNFTSTFPSSSGFALAVLRRPWKLFWQTDFHQLAGTLCWSEKYFHYENEPDDWYRATCPDLNLQSVPVSCEVLKHILNCSTCWPSLSQVPYRTKFRRTIYPKIWLATENFLSTKTFVRRNFVRRSIRRSAITVFSAVETAEISSKYQNFCLLTILYWTIRICKVKPNNV